MNGFVKNYLVQKQLNPQENYDPKSVMHYFTSDQAPVLSQLAKRFAVCDHWFASAPCQTWPNRWFVHAATADHHENNNPHAFPLSSYRPMWRLARSSAKQAGRHTITLQSSPPCANASA
jgi:phospholipase C